MLFYKLKKKVNFQISHLVDNQQQYHIINNYNSIQMSNSNMKEIPMLIK